MLVHSAGFNRYNKRESKWENGVKWTQRNMHVGDCSCSRGSSCGWSFNMMEDLSKKNLTGECPSQHRLKERVEGRITTLLMWPLSRPLMASGWWLERAGICVNVTIEWFRSSGALLSFVYRKMPPHTHTHPKIHWKYKQADAFKLLFSHLTLTCAQRSTHTHRHTTRQTFFTTRPLFAKVLSSRQIVFEIELFT